MHTTDPSHADPHAADAHDNPGYEVRDAKIRPLVESGIILTLITAASFWSMVWVHDALSEHFDEASAPRPSLAAERDIPPEPHLQSMPGAPLRYGERIEAVGKPFDTTNARQHVDRAREHLRSWGWVDEQAGLAHVPIEHAMEMVLKKGLPSRR